MKYITKLLIIICTIGFAQEKITVIDHLKSPRGKLFLGFGTEYRIVPFLKVKNKEEQVSGFGKFKVLDNNEVQNSGIAFNYNLKYFFTNKLSLTFNNSFKRSLLMYNLDIPAGFGAKGADYAIAVDYQLLLDYHFRLNKESQLYARLGVERMNTNTNYISKFSYFNTDGTLLGTEYVTYNFAYFSNNFAIGYIRNKLDCTLGIRSSSNTEFAEVQATYFVPFIKLNYILTKL